TEYQQTEYQQGEHQQGEYQQGEYQQGGYQQDYQQGGYQQGDETQQHSSEPGVLPVSSEYQDQPQGEQQQDFSASNNTWWGNSDPNAAEQHPAVEGGAQQVPQEDYEEGQFISFGAVPAIPTFGQPSAPAVNNNNTPHSFGEDDDLGMGNSSLKKDKPAVPAEGDAATVAQDSDAPNPAGDGSDESKAGWSWPKIALFGGEKREPTPKPVKANLGEESSFYFDKEQQRWVNKKAGSDNAAAAAPLPPPPMSRTATPAAAGSPTVGGPPSRSGPPSASGTPPAVGGPSPVAGGPPRPGTGSSARRGARSRYVDVLNTN
ncbi:hypothetical protein BGX21_000958, partial [Mortierella sp. AD011]